MAGLLGRLVERLTGGGPMVVVGASGAGKSSVLRAGLLPTLARDGLGLEGSRDWPWLLLTPGPRPLQELATQTAGLLNGVDALNLLRGLREMPDGYGAVAAQAAQASGPDAARLVIVVDQFEELFTQCTDEAERAAFVTALTSAGPALVVLAVRADFYPQCTRLAALAPALAAGQVVVGPLTRDGLTRAVHGPAERAGLAVEPGLVEVLLADLGAHPAADPGPVALPLLAHALRATWQRRRGHTLTVAGYRATGGIADAVAETAEAIHAGLDEPGRAALRAGLLRMVTVTEAGAVVRRRAALDELPQPALVRLVAARLVTVSEDSAEISHEALLAAWPRLAGWVADARQDLVLRHRLGEAARYWREAGRDPGSLYRGARLAQAREWADGRDDLTAAEAGFLAASAAGADAALRTERRRTRLLRRLVAALAVLLLAVPAVTAVAFTERGAAQQRQQDADRQRAEAVSRQFAAESVDNTDADPRRAMLLALAAWESRHTVEARSALLSAQSLDHAGELGDQPGGRTVAISPDGSLVAIGRTSGAVELWDARTHRQRALVRPASGKTAFAVRFSPDGKLLAAASVEQNGLRVWEVPSGRLRYTLPGAVSVAWGAGGTSLAAPYPDLRDPSRWLVNVWDAATGRLSHALPVGGRLPARVAYSADGGRIATGNGDGTVSLLRVSDGALLATLGGHGPGAVAVAFAPDGTLATGGANGTVQLWDWRTGRRLATLLEQGDVTTVIALAFTPDSGVLLVAGGSVQIRLWLMATRELLGHFSGGPTVLDVGVSGDGRTVVGTGLGAPTGLWRRATHILGHPTGAVVDVAYDPTGGTLASTGADHTVRLWDTATGKARATVTLPDQVLRAASSPDGTLAVAVLDGTVRLLDRTGRIRATLGLGGREPDDVAFSPDGRLLAAASSPPLRRTRKAEPGTVIYLWDARTLQQRGQIHLRDPEDDSIAAITFTPDGGRLLAAMTLTKIIGRDGDPAQTGRVRIWRTADLTETPAIAMGSEQVVTVAVSPDGRTLAAGGTDRTIGLWALVSGKPIGDRFGTHPAAIRSIAFSPDGSVLATTNIGDGTVRLWDLRSRIVVASVAGHFEGVNAVIFAPGGRSVASAGEDGGIGLWDTGPDRVEAALCQILAGPTFATEWADVTRRAPAGTVAPAPPCR